MSSDQTSGRSVAVVIVNYKRATDTLAAVESLCRSDHPHWRAIIVDNESDDGSYQTLRALEPDALLIRSTANLGFAGGCNLAIERARQEGYDYIFLLNNDATVTPGTIGELVAASIAKQDRALLGSAVKIAGSDAYQFIGAQWGPLGGADWVQPVPGTAYDGLVETAFILGAALFIPTPLLAEIGLFDERFFLNYEETDFCRRGQALGIPSWIVGTSVVFHAVGANLGEIDGPMQTYFMTRNELLFLQKHGSRKQQRDALKRHGWWCAVHLKREILAGRGPALSTRARLLAIRDYLAGRFGDCPPIIRHYAREDSRRRRARAEALGDGM